MKCLTKAAFMSILAMTTLLAESKLVVYGPQELIDKFNKKDSNDLNADGDDSSQSAGGKKNKKPVINANYANFGHIPYGQSLIGTIYFDKTNPDMCSKSNAETLQELDRKQSSDK